MPRSEERRLESMADPSGWGDLDENDPKSMARMMKKMGTEMGEDLGPEFNEVVDRLEAGEDAESIESSLAAGEGKTTQTTSFEGSHKDVLCPILTPIGTQ